MEKEKKEVKDQGLKVLQLRGQGGEEEISKGDKQSSQ